MCLFSAFYPLSTLCLPANAICPTYFIFAITCFPFCLHTQRKKERKTLLAKRGVISNLHKLKCRLRNQHVNSETHSTRPHISKMENMLRKIDKKRNIFINYTIRQSFKHTHIHGEEWTRRLFAECRQQHTHSYDRSKYSVLEAHAWTLLTYSTQYEKKQKCRNECYITESRNSAHIYCAHTDIRRSFKSCANLQLRKFLTTCLLIRSRICLCVPLNWLKIFWHWTKYGNGKRRNKLIMGTRVCVCDERYIAEDPILLLLLYLPVCYHIILFVSLLFHFYLFIFSRTCK